METTQVKNEQVFIGKGVKNSKRIRINICIDDAQRCLTEYKGKFYLQAFITELQTPDQYGKTHTIYAFVPEDNSNTANSEQE